MIFFKTNTTTVSLPVITNDMLNIPISIINKEEPYSVNISYTNNEGVLVLVPCIELELTPELSQFVVAHFKFKVMMNTIQEILKSTESREMKINKLNLILSGIDDVYGLFKTELVSSLEHCIQNLTRTQRDFTNHNVQAMNLQRSVSDRSDRVTALYHTYST